MNEVKQTVGLINCDACGKEISAMAAQCPGCGAPNNWIHPNIKHFISVKDQTGMSKPFTFQWNKTEIWRGTEAKLPWWLWLVIIFCAAPGFAFGIIPGLIIAPVAYFILIQFYGKKHEFKANLQEGTWVSSDDQLWQPVKSILKI